MGIREQLGVKPGRDLLEDSGGVIAITGPKGAGKTTLGTSVVNSEYVLAHAEDKDCPLLIFNIEAGLSSVSHLRSKFDYWDITDWNTYEKKIDLLVGSPDFPWGAIEVDNATELAEMNLKKITREAKKSVPEWPEFRKNADEMVTQVRKLRDLARQRGIVVIFNVWDKEETDDAGNLRKITLDMTPKVRDRFIGAVDAAAWLEVLDDGPPGTRVLHLEGNNKVAVKRLRKPPIGPGSDIPLDLFWRNPENTETPLVAIIESIFGGKEWDKSKFLPPPNVRPSIIRRAPATGRE